MLLGLQIRNDDPASALAAWGSDGDVGKGGRRAFVPLHPVRPMRPALPSGPNIDPQVPLAAGSIECNGVRREAYPPTHLSLLPGNLHRDPAAPP
jgi:hypothetical protein